MYAAVARSVTEIGQSFGSHDFHYVKKWSLRENRQDIERGRTEEGLMEVLGCGTRKNPY